MDTRHVMMKAAAELQFVHNQVVLLIDTGWQLGKLMT